MSTPTPEGGGQLTDGATPTPAATKEKAAAAAPEIGQMKRGDYMIHVFIEQARQLKCPDGKTVDPLIECEIMGEKKHTTAKDDIGGATARCTWNEHLFFEPKNVSKEDIEEAKICIKVLDKGYFKDAMIGCYDLDVSYIYFMKGHSLLHRWVALSNPMSKNYEEICGYLKISIAVTTKGDETVQISEDNSSPDKSDEPILMPSQLKPSYQQITIRIFCAEKLPMLDNAVLGMGKGVSIDAYLVCNYLTHKLRTQVITAKENEQIKWYQEFLLPVQLPIMSGRVVLKLFDQDKTLDEVVGSILLNLKDFIETDAQGKTLNGKIFWKNIYGAPVGFAGANTDMMNSNPELGSTWKGRVLIQVCAQKTDKPTALKRPIKDSAVIEKAQEQMQKHTYDIIAEVCQGISLPGNNDKFNVRIQVADYKVQTEKPIIVEGSYNRWSCRFKTTAVELPYPCVEKIGRIFVYLMQGDTPICYYKGDIADFKEPNAQIKWVEMINDLSVGKIKDSYKAGVISFKLSIQKRERKDAPQFDFRQYDSWKVDPPKRTNVLMARAYIYQCRDLPSADDDGQSDPFIEVWSQTGGNKRTQIIEDNNNPIFFEAVEIPIIECYTGVNDLPPFILDVYDHDPISNDFIGRSIIQVKQDDFSQDRTIPKPKWYPVRMRVGGPEQGQILASFSIVASDYKFDDIKTGEKQQKVKNTVQFQEFQVDINVLGLRDLQSVGILPVKKAFVTFNLKSLVAPSDGRALENIKTQPGPTGANPTINSTMSFRVPLPTDPLYCPKLVCAVYDYIFKGINQPLIGTFTIPIGELIYTLREEREREIGVIRKITEELDKIIRGESIPIYKPQTSQMNSINDGGSSGGKESTSIKREVKPQTKKKEAVLIEEELKIPLLDDQMQIQPRTNSRDSIELAGSLTLKGARAPTRVNLRPNKIITAKDAFLETEATDQFEPVPASGGNAPLARKQTIANSFQIEKVDKVKDFNKAELILDFKLQQEKLRREEQDERMRQMAEFKSQGGNVFKNIVMPVYEMDKRLKVYREVKMPPISAYIGLGWDENPPEQKRKHYRRYYTQELETVKEIMPVESPFASFSIMRGQSRGATKQWWKIGGQKEDDAGEVTTETVVGKFKGIVTVQSEEDMAQYKRDKEDLILILKEKLNILSVKETGKQFLTDDRLVARLQTFEGKQKFENELEELGIAHLNIVKHIADLYSEDILTKLLLSQQKCIIRLYVISAYNLSSRDNGSDSDPYLIVSCGNRTYDERKNYQDNEPNPDFYKMFEFDGVFPGCGPIVLKVMDYDDIFGDEAIGTTQIDLEDRYFSPEWQSIKNKPIEYRQLYHPSSSISQGTVKLWVQIFPTTIPLNEIPNYDITPKPAEEFEVRVVIYDTLNIKMMDVEGTSDVYCRAFFDSAVEAKETDTHYRCSNGKASFNYRMLFNLKHPRKDYSLTLQLYDRDFFKSNDLIGDATFDIKLPLEDVSLSKRQCGVTKTYYNSYLKDLGFKLEFKDEDTFWIPIKQVNKDDPSKVDAQGKIRVRIDIFPKGLADSNKVGEARQEPNHSPFLPPPVGRLNLSMNPFKMLNQMVGPAMLKKLYCYTCLACCCALILAMLPLIFSDIMSNLISKLLGIN